MMDEAQELDTFHTQKGPASNGHDEVEAQPEYDKDQFELAQTGKKQVLKVSSRCKTFLTHISFRTHSVTEKLWLYANSGV